MSSKKDWSDSEARAADAVCNPADKTALMRIVRKICLDTVKSTRNIPSPDREGANRRAKVDNTRRNAVRLDKIFVNALSRREHAEKSVFHNSTSLSSLFYHIARKK